MRVDGELGSGSGREPEDLRRILRQWKVPGPPPEIEDDLRRTFRRRRGRRPPLLWLAVAASLALLLVYEVKGPGRPARPVVAERPTLRTPPPPPRVEANRREARATPDPAARTPRAPAAPPAEGAVIVEPRQAELLAQLARQLQGARQAPPGVSVPRIEAVAADAPPPQIRATQWRDTVLQYRDHWEKVGDEWPFVYRSL
jgi:hypothetical protein